MYELWLAIVSHPITSCRQNKNLLWLIRKKTGQLWIDCTPPVCTNINSNEVGSMSAMNTLCIYEKSQKERKWIIKKGSHLGSVSLNNIISALWLFVCFIDSLPCPPPFFFFFEKWNSGLEAQFLEVFFSKPGCSLDVCPTYALFQQPSKIITAWINEWMSLVVLLVGCTQALFFCVASVAFTKQQSLAQEAHGKNVW